MLFVCLSHFGNVFLHRIGPSATHFVDVVWEVSMIATPAFIIISGVTLGYVHASAPERFGAFRRKLLDRGLFLLTAGHVLIYLSHVHIAGGLGPGLRWAFITDTIGVNIIVGPMLVGWLRPRARIAMAAALFVLTWALVTYWHPAGLAGRIAHDGLFGPSGTSVFTDVFPLVPWFAVYFAASTLGEGLASARRGQAEDGMTHLLVGLGLAGLAGVLALRVARAVIVPMNLPVVSEAIWELSSPFGKLPPTLAYLLAFGSLGLLLLALFVVLERRAEFASVLEGFSVVGRTSLFAFVVQYYLIFTLLDMLPVHAPSAWALAFMAFLVVLWVACGLWDRRGYNRFITVGYPAFERRLHRSGGERAPA
jgi:hypothetical protein